jgi:preprotein translocase subunit SecG
MIYTLILVLHVLVCLVLVASILVQRGKGASMGAAFGTAGSQTVFGSAGAGNFLTKPTSVCAVIFFSTSLLLAYRSSFRHSVVADYAAPASDTAPAAPAGTEAPKTPPAPGDVPGGTAPAPKAAAPAAPTPAAPAAPTAPAK